VGLTAQQSDNQQQRICGLQGRQLHKGGNIMHNVITITLLLTVLEATGLTQML
jgi:hypothetical protein